MSRGSSLGVDHLNTVRLIAAASGTGDLNIKTHKASRHVLRWLEDALETTGHLTVIHEKAHTGEKTRTAIMNDLADAAAKKARSSTVEIGYLKKYTDNFQLSTKATGVTHAMPNKVLREVYHRHVRPEFSKLPHEIRFFSEPHFTKKIKAFTALVLWMSRSRQLPVQRKVWARKVEKRKPLVQCNDCSQTYEETKKKRVCLSCPSFIQAIAAEDNIPTCPRCDVPEYMQDERHAFMECPGSAAIREQQQQKINNRVDNYFEAKGLLGKDAHLQHKRLAAGLLVDSEYWTDSVCQFWLGVLPGGFTYNTEYRWLYNQLARLVSETTSFLWSKQQAPDSW